MFKILVAIPLAELGKVLGRTRFVGRADVCSAAIVVQVEYALDADGERLARKVGKMDRRVEGLKTVLRRYANDRRQRRCFGRRRVDLHDGEQCGNNRPIGTKKQHKLREVRKKHGANSRRERKSSTTRRKHAKVRA